MHKWNVFCTHAQQKIPKSAKVENAKGLCPHVQTITTHIDSVKSYFPEYFTSHIEMSLENNPDEEEIQKIISYLITTLRVTLMYKLDCGIFIH